MGWYRAVVTCRCGQVHGLGIQLQIPGGTPFGRQAGTGAELYPSGEVPPVLRGLLHDLFWCDEAKEYLEIAGPERVTLTPIQGR